MLDREKEDKMRGDLREDMPERDRKTKCGGVANNIEGVCRRGIKKTKWGGVLRKKLRGVVCWRGVKKTKCGRRGSPKN